MYLTRKSKAVALIIFLITASLWANEYYEKDGGEGISIAVEAVKVVNVGDIATWLPECANNIVADSKRLQLIKGVI